MGFDGQTLAHFRNMVFDYINRVNLVTPVSEVNPKKTPQVFSDTLNVSLVDMDTISATITAKVNIPNVKIAILNFASYKSPGGGFIKGQMAQEEALCYCTNLYPELAKHQSWYNEHLKNLNDGLYGDESILSHNISVIGNQCGALRNPSEVFTIDVLTCAAPNWAPLIRYKTVSGEEMRLATKQRIEYVMHTLSQDRYDVIILGAFGCGVFKNDPLFVAQCFKASIVKYRGCFKHIIFAIPGRTSKNYLSFEQVFK